MLFSVLFSTSFSYVIFPAAEYFIAHLGVPQSPVFIFRIDLRACSAALTSCAASFGNLLYPQVGLSLQTSGFPVYPSRFFFQRLRLPSSFLSHKDAGVLLPACPFLLLAQKKRAKEKGSTAWCFVETEPSHCLVRYDINNATHAAPSRNFKIEQADCDSAARKRCRAGRDFWVSVSFNYFFQFLHSCRAIQFPKKCVRSSQIYFSSQNQSFKK